MAYQTIYTENIFMKFLKMCEYFVFSFIKSLTIKLKTDLKILSFSFHNVSGKQQQRRRQ